MFASLKQEIIDALKPLHGPDEAAAIAGALLRYMNVTSPHAALDGETKDLIGKAVIRLCNGEPLQYITGEVVFYGCTIKTDKRALIPRPETEELTDIIVRQIKNSSPLHVLDVGTGSGCIPIAIKKNCHQHMVRAADISIDALELAKTNAALNHVEIDFLQLDITKRFPAVPIDILISNPPYIAVSERTSMAKTVTDFEPDIALFVPDEDPLLFYRKLAALAERQLPVSGKAFFEINQRLAKDTAALFDARHFKAEVKQDMSGNDRFVIVNRYR